MSARTSCGRQITLVGSWTFSTQGQADCAEFVADP